MAPTTLAQWIAHIEQLHPVAIDFERTRLRQVAQRLDLEFSCPVFTVAGTNGKGSTCAMLESILQSAGYRTAVYSSPHLVHFNERLRLNGQDVSDELLVTSFEHIETQRKIAAVSLTFFEFTTLSLLYIIKNTALDAIILEVGLGGRLDAVNIIDTDCAIITSIDLDHTQILGDTREQIGLEKAGIMRRQKPAIISDPVPPQSVLYHAEEIGAELWLAGRDFFTQGTQQQWDFTTNQGRDKRRYTALAYPALRGANQLINAAGVLAALTALRDKLPITAQAVRVGLANATLPGRFQMVPGKPSLVLDVAHNPHAASVLAHNLDAMGFFPKTSAVFGMMADKDIESMLTKLGPLVNQWYFTDLPSNRAAKASTIHALWKTQATTHQEAAQIFSDPVSALQAALKDSAPEDRILVCGSFYTVGAILAHDLKNFR